jgi:hypothetical protein
LAGIIKCVECLGGHHAGSPQTAECRETRLLRASLRDHGPVQHDRRISRECIFRVRHKAPTDFRPLAKEHLCPTSLKSRLLSHYQRLERRRGDVFNCFSSVPVSLCRGVTCTTGQFWARAILMFAAHCAWLICIGSRAAASCRNENGSYGLRWHRDQPLSQRCGRRRREGCSRIWTSDRLRWPRPLVPKSPTQRCELEGKGRGGVKGPLGQ